MTTQIFFCTLVPNNTLSQTCLTKRFSRGWRCVAEFLPFLIGSTQQLQFFVLGTNGWYQILSQRLFLILVTNGIRCYFQFGFRNSSLNEVERILTENYCGKGQSVWQEMHGAAWVRFKAGWHRDEIIEEVVTCGVKQRRRLAGRQVRLATRGLRSRNHNMTMHKKNLWGCHVRHMD